MPNKRALIIGIGGQDGYFMSWMLSREGYKVTGILRPEDMTEATVSHLPRAGVRLVKGSVCDGQLIRSVIREDLPQYIYNFSGLSFIPYSWQNPGLVTEINGFAVGQILDIIRREIPECRFFQAGSSEMFGHYPVTSPQDEGTPFNPDNPYGSSKVFATHMVRCYRSHFGLFACTGILYNHESPWRRPEFVTRKITRAAAAISLGRAVRLTLGDLDALRDWSYAGDFVEAMRLMVKADEPKDYVIASGTLHSVKDVLDTAFGHVGLSWEENVEIEESLKRPSEEAPLCGNSSRIRQDLHWKPRVQFEDLICMMVDEDRKRLT